MNTKKSNNKINLKKTAVIIIISVLVLIVGVLTCQRVANKIKQSKIKPEKAVYSVGIIKAKKSLLKETITGHAIIKGNPQIKLYTRGDLSGLFIRNNFKEGDFVNKGDIIATVDRNIPGNDYNDVPVTAEISGVITKLYFLDKGSKVKSSDPVAEIANINSVKLTVNLGASDITKVKKNQNVTITSDFDPNLKINAKVDSVTPFIDTDSLSGDVTIYIDNANRILPLGLSVNVEIAVAERLTYVVPDNAVLVDDENSYIYINNNNIAKQVVIKSGFSSAGSTEIFGEINDGDEIITNGNFKLKNGDKINAVYN